MAGQVSKLNYVDRKLGTIGGQQQTTRVLYDTIQVNAGDPTQELKFFDNFAGKGIAQTNLTTNKLDSSESMVIKQIQFAQVFANSSNPNDPNPAQTYIMNVYVGNQRVIKNFPLFVGRQGGSLYGLYRLSSNNIATGVQQNFPSGYTVFRALTDIVIPPQTNFRVTITKGGTNAWAPTNAGAIETKYYLLLKGYGQIFSAGNSF